ncbi:hypothetical protein hairong_166 [Pseudomonas phage hairong]|nr:hypothetical protein hairong_166 [Pseudomonas phage hairong]
MQKKRKRLTEHHSALPSQSISSRSDAVAARQKISSHG